MILRRTIIAATIILILGTLLLIAGIFIIPYDPIDSRSESPITGGPETLLGILMLITGIIMLAIALPTRDRYQREHPTQPKQNISWYD